MIFSAEILKCNSISQNKRLYSGNTIKESFNTKALIESVDIDTIRNNRSMNISDKLQAIISGFKGEITTSLYNTSNRIDNEFKHNNEYIFIKDPSTEYKVDRILYSQDISNIDLTDTFPYGLNTKGNISFDAPTYIITIKNLIDNFIKFIEDINKASLFGDSKVLKVITDYTNTTNNLNSQFDESINYNTDYSEDNRTVFSTEEIEKRKLFDSTSYSKKINNCSSYIVRCLDDLASRIQEIPEINLSDNISSEIRSNVDSIANQFINSIYKYMSLLKNYCYNYGFEMEANCNENVRIIHTICEDDNNDLDANKITSNSSENLDENLLYTSLYSAFEEAYNAAVELDLLTESAGLIILQEAGKLNLMQYVTKVMEGIKKAWEKFKAKITDLKKKSAKKYIARLTKDAATLPDDLQFQVKNFPIVDTNKLNLVKVIPFNYEAMKDDLKSSDAFTSKYYQNIPKTEGEGFKASLEKFFITNTTDLKITKEVLMKTIVPLLDPNNSFTEEAMKADIETINKSAEAISRLGSQTGQQGQAPTPIETKTTEESAIIVEADNDKPQIVDDPNRTASADNASIAKDVQVYLTACADIVSAKMKVIRDSQILAYRVLVHAFTPAKKKEEKK